MDHVHVSRLFRQEQRGVMRKNICIFMVLVFLCFPAMSLAQETRTIGEVSTEWKFLGPNHKIKIFAFDDPDIPQITCYLSRAVKGGIKGALGVEEDKASSSITCVLTGQVNEGELRKLKQGAEVFRQRASFLFKSVKVVRFIDFEKGVITYLTYSRKIISGSHKNSVAAVCYK